MCFAVIIVISVLLTLSITEVTIMTVKHTLLYNLKLLGNQLSGFELDEKIDVMLNVKLSSGASLCSAFCHYSTKRQLYTCIKILMGTIFRFCKQCQMLHT